MNADCFHDRYCDRASHIPSAAIAGLDPAIQEFEMNGVGASRCLDCRVKPGNDIIGGVSMRLMRDDEIKDLRSSAFIRDQSSYDNRL
jgi:hypothetical protein